VLVGYGVLQWQPFLGCVKPDKALRAISEADHHGAALKHGQSVMGQ
jgi:hypothetical protein